MGCRSVIDPFLHWRYALLLALTVEFGFLASAQAASPEPHNSHDLSWVRQFAAPPASGARVGENALNGSPSFHLLLKSSLPQRQSFWYDHYRFPPVSDLVHTFIGVPGSVILDENRYVTADGCVPHDCQDRGMVWIDTGATGSGDSSPAPLIFVALGLIANGPAENGMRYHLWLFSRTRLNWEKMPAPFLSSLRRWNDTNRANGYSEQIILVTLVQPTGQMVDLSPTLFSFSPPQAGAMN